jgi:hypothetical protein
VKELESTLDALVAGAPVSAADWQDVVGRARRPRRRALAALAVAAALGAIVVATPAFGIGERIRGLFDGTPVEAERLDPRALHNLSAMASGVSPRDPASEQEDRARFEASSFRQIATRGNRVFFVADRSGGGLCVSVADIGDPDVIGSIGCSPDFPSAERPIFDESRIHARVIYDSKGRFRGLAEPQTAMRLEGFAADGVASVALLTVEGAIEAVTPVEDNVYLRTEGLPTEPIAAIVALDADGNRLYSQCMVRKGCEK